MTLTAILGESNSCLEQKIITLQKKIPCQSEFVYNDACEDGCLDSVRDISSVKQLVWNPDCTHQRREYIHQMAQVFVLVSLAQTLTLEKLKLLTNGVQENYQRVGFSLIHTHKPFI